MHIEQQPRFQALLAQSYSNQSALAFCALSNGPYSHKGITINSYVNCLSNIAFASSIWLFHLPIFGENPMRIWCDWSEYKRTGKAWERAKQTAKEAEKHSTKY